MKYLTSLDLNQNQLIRARVENLGAFPGSPVLGQIFYHTGDATIYQYDGVGPSGGGGWTSLAAGFTNLGYTPSATNGIITSDTGTDAIIPLATTNDAGLLSPAFFDYLTNPPVVSGTLTAGTGISGTTYSPGTSTTFNLDFTELTLKSTAVSGITEIILNDAGTESRKTIQTIDLSFFDNTISAFSSTLGTVTGLGSTTLSIGGTSAIPTVNLTSGIVPAGTTGSSTLIPVITVDTYGRITTIGTAANPQGTVTSVAVNDGTGIDVVSTGTGAAPVYAVNLANTAPYTILANNTAGTAAPTPFTTVQGSVIGRVGGAITNILIDADLSDVSTSDNTIASAKAVKTYVDNLLAANDAMVFKGTVGTGGTLTIAAFNALTVYNAGWTYRVIEAGTIKGEIVEVGDMFIATVDRASGGVNADWTVVQTNLDGVVIGPASAVNSNFAAFDATSGKLIKDSGFNSGSFMALGTGVVSVGGTANRITSSGGTSPVIDISAAYVGQTSITTLGTIGTGTWQGGVISTTYTQAKVISLGGTSNRITIGGTTTAPTVNIASTYVGQTSITTLGTITTGVWSGTEILGSKLQNATTTIKGVVEVATQTEVTNGTALGTTGASLVVTPATLQAKLNAEIAATKFAVNIGDGNATSITITDTLGTINHNLGTNGDFIVQVRVAATGEVVICDITLNSSTGAVTLDFNTAPALNEYRVVISA